MFKKLFSKIFGDPNKRYLNKLLPLVEEVASLEDQVKAMSDETLKAQTAVLKDKYAADQDLEAVLPMACALVREASRRSIGLRHYDVQIMGGILLHRGEVVEMRTGEGKTLVATIPLYLNALTGKGVHLVTVNEYLVRRDGGWMGKVFHALGLTTGCIGPLQFSALYDPEYVNPGAELEDERLVHWRPCNRRQAYEADITYGISSEFGFDYLRDNMVPSADKLVQRPLHYAVIDEVDNILIDEARTPLIISGPAARSGQEYVRFAQYVRGLRKNTAEEDEDPDGHYDLDEKSRSVSLTEIGITELEKRIEELNPDAGDSLYDPRFYHLTYYLDNALRAQYLFKKDVDYVVQNGEVLIIDDFTGRLMPGRRYSDGLHEAIEAKENVEVKRETVTVATITLQNYFRLYDKLAGMTGTAMTDAEEFDKIYELPVTPLPTNVEFIAETGKVGLIAQSQKLDGVEQVVYLDAETKKPKYFKRVDYRDQVYGTVEAKDKAILNEIMRVHQTGRPVLVGTTSVEHSETIHHHLTRAKIDHTILNAKIHQSEALIVAQAGRRGAVTISTNMAGRGTDIILGGNPEGLAASKLEKELFDRRLLNELSEKLFVEGEESARTFAHKHPKLVEPLVDELLKIKKELDVAQTEIEQVQVIGYVSRILQEPYDIDYTELLNIIRLVRGNLLSEAREHLDKLGKDVALVDEIIRLWDLHTNYQMAKADPQHTAKFVSEILFEKNYSARAAIIRATLGRQRDEAEKILEMVPGLPKDLVQQIEALEVQAQKEREEIWQLGGLHVVGSERHESRRIDNQLRGRAARQGDPGSSRFFLSLEDDLMRRFGGERLKSWMSSGYLAQLPEDMPLEFGVLDRIIESSQERIEGYNFDIRKNVVEYDDVMNKQRQAIYDERRAILLGEADDGLDVKIDNSFEMTITELVGNYIENYAGFLQMEIGKAVDDFSTDATDSVNAGGVVARLRGLLPGIVEFDRNELAELSPSQLKETLKELIYENEESGQNLLQLLQAMGRFLPLLPPVPNLGALATMRSGQLQLKEKMHHQYLLNVQMLFNEFLADTIDAAEQQVIWQKAETAINEAFHGFSLDGLTVQDSVVRQAHFKALTDEALRTLLLESLAALDSEQMVQALRQYVQKQRDKWRQHIGEAEYCNFRRLLLLSAMDREWRDYLTAMDDLRREIGLEAVGQRDPKVQYKRRSFEMFADMRRNIDRDVVERFFHQIATHEAFIRKQEEEVQYQLKAQDAGYQAIQRKEGKGVELRRDAPKVGRNDPCPCGSGKKYKQCHGRTDGASGEATAVTPDKTAAKPNNRRR